MRPMLSLLIAILASIPVSAQTAAPQAAADRIEFQGCSAAWSETELTVGNSHFEQKWALQDGVLTPVSLHTAEPDAQWLVAPAGKKTPGGTLDVEASTGRSSPVAAESLTLSVDVSGKSNGRVVLRVFPKASGVLVESPTAGMADLRLAPEHLRLVEVTLADQTDGHNELAFEREWLLMPRERRIEMAGNLIYLEDTLTQAGLVFVKLAPLPHARQQTSGVDFTVEPGRRQVAATADGYPLAVLAYRGGRTGRIAALQAFQRELRVFDPFRDGMFLSNTWGDRSRDARINEAFIQKEIEAGARLGVDVIQIDDGWQQGRSANSSKGKGVWNGYWAADPHFWNPDPERFPRGLGPLVEAARDRGMKFGLWFAPDSSNDAANWRRDADCILDFHRKLGIDYFKVDSIKTPNVEAAANQRRLFDRVLDGSDGQVVFDLDVTAEIRPGYFGLPDIGPIFVENRYTDFHSYWPHQTLRNLWKLSQYVDPLRLRIEFLNNARNADKYAGDPLAPSRYRADTLFATTMMANPLGWFEVSNLPDEFVSQAAPLVSAWKRERTRLHGGRIIPIGHAPDGVSWTGFASLSTDRPGGYVLLFRELSASPAYALDLAPLMPGTLTPTVLAGRGTARLQDGRLAAEIPAELDYLWIRLDAAQ